ncbi:MAG: hypothetical protein GY702_13195 [Desulfobulbaceae bacterium]|nr:hypothetical protein [Desulfobulbaceae bacterium]
MLEPYAGKLARAVLRREGSRKASDLSGVPHTEMIDIYSKIVNKNRAIWLVSSLLIIYNLIKIFSIIGPPYVMSLISNVEEGLSFSDYQIAFQTYISEAAKILEISADSIKLNFAFTAITSLLYIFLAFFLGKRKKFAKNMIISLVFIEVAIVCFICIYTNTLPSVDSTFVAIMLLLFLFSPNMSKAFN